MSFVRFAPLSAIPPGRNKTMRIGLRHVAVFNLDGTLYAIEDACAHMKAPLSAGRVRGTEITCSRHGWVYDITTGERVGKEAGSVRTFPVKVEGDMIWVDPTVSDADSDLPPGEYEDELPPIVP